VYDYITNCGGNKQRSYKLMRINIFASLGRAKPDTKYKKLKLGGGQAYDSSID
jgi:hypothetical protein